jgi:hypothetical protein
MDAPQYHEVVNSHREKFGEEKRGEERIGAGKVFNTSARFIVLDFLGLLG